MGNFSPADPASQSGRQKIFSGGVSVAVTKPEQTAKDSHVTKPDACAGTVSGGIAAEPQDIADLIAFLVSPAARWITGTRLRIDGGEVKSI